MGASKIVTYVVLILSIIVQIINLAAKALMSSNAKDLKDNSLLTSVDSIKGYYNFGITAAIFSMALIVYFLVTRLMDKICHDTVDVMLWQTLVALQFALATAFVVELTNNDAAYDAYMKALDGFEAAGTSNATVDALSTFHSIQRTPAT